MILAFKDCRARGARRFRRTVRAVVRDNKDVDLIVWIILRQDAVHEAGDYGLLIPGGNKNRVIVIYRFAVRFCFFKKGNCYVNKLVGKTDEEQHSHNIVEQAYDFRKNPSDQIAAGKFSPSGV